MTEVDAVLNEIASPLAVSDVDGDVGRLLR